VFWVVGIREPAVATCVICAVLGAACSVTSAFAIARYGQRARLRRVARKYGLAVVQRPQPVGAVS
jgi:membrane protein DedA with SNARE-associated domain